MSSNNHQGINSTKALHFTIQDVRMCIYLENIYKVLPLVELKKIPDSPNYFIGLLNFKGQPIPIFDLAIKTGLGRDKKYSIDMSIILCKDIDRMIGFIADEIIGVIDIDHAELQLKDEFEKDNSFFISTVNNDQDLALLVNIKQLIHQDVFDRK